MPNLEMGNIANSVLFPCLYDSNGCRLAFQQEDLTGHKKKCERKHYCCPGALCKWQGTLEDMLPHMLTTHNEIIIAVMADWVVLRTDAVALP